MLKAIVVVALGAFMVFPVLGQEDSKKIKESLKNRPEMSGSEQKISRAEKKLKPATSADVPTSTSLKARSHIKTMKNGVLLVRLRTSENAIKKLEKAGNEQMATTLRRRQEADNKKLAKAFQQHFKFCPVYFFYSSETEKIKGGQTSGVFLNEALEVSPEVVLPNRNFYVAEITDLEQFRPEPDDPNASNNAEVSFKALVIRDQNFHQLNKPFPYFIKASQNIPPRKRSETEMVMLLNERLNSYYKEATKNAR